MPVAGSIEPMPEGVSFQVTVWAVVLGETVTLSATDF